MQVHFQSVLEGRYPSEADLNSCERINYTLARFRIVSICSVVEIPVQNILLWKEKKEDI
jgi:hypothetical protein